jgi:hypothetical protein
VCVCVCVCVSDKERDRINSILAKVGNNINSLIGVPWACFDNANL